MILSNKVKSRNNRARYIHERLYPLADKILARSEHDKRNGIACMRTLRHVFDIAVIARHNEGYPRRFRISYERRKESVVRFQNVAGARVVERMP